KKNGSKTKEEAQHNDVSTSSDSLGDRGWRGWLCRSCPLLGRCPFPPFAYGLDRAGSRFRPDALGGDQCVVPARCAASCAPVRIRLPFGGNPATHSPCGGRTRDHSPAPRR